VTDEEFKLTIRLAVGLGVPLVLSPFAVLGLRRLFGLFITEGVELFSTVLLENEDAKTLGSLMAKLNVAVMLLAWIILFTCHCLDVRHLVVMGIALAGVMGAILITVLTIKSNLPIEGRALWMVSLLAFTGGNLPIIVIVGVLLAVFSRILLG